MNLHLVSHHLCPYVQRALIVAAEKKVELDRTYIDLSDKPAWFLKISPTSKTPLLRVQAGDDEHVLFESAAICEFLDEVSGDPMMPESALERAKHRGWIEYASGALADIAALYNAPDEPRFQLKRRQLMDRFRRLDETVGRPYFSGDRVSLVDAAFGPVFRYLDVFEGAAGLWLADGLPAIAAWRDALAGRRSVVQAVAPDYRESLHDFLRARPSHLSRMLSG